MISCQKQRAVRTRSPWFCLVALFGVLIQRTANSQQPTDRIDIGKRATALVVVANGRGFGSAFCISKSGYFLTNNHVVRRTDDCVIVTEPGEATQREFNAVVVRRDEDADLAVLRLLDTDAEFTPLAIGDTDPLRETDQVVTFGYPLANRSQPSPNITVIVGRITSLRKAEGVLDSIQLDVDLKPGNFGGPVIDENGAVVGVVRAGRFGSGTVTAIPAPLVKDFLTAPDVKIVPPEIVNAKEMVEMRVEVRDLISENQRYSASLRLKSSPSDQRIILMETNDGQNFRATFVPQIPGEQVESVRIVAKFDEGEIKCLLTNEAIQVAERWIFLADLQRIEKTDSAFLVTHFAQEGIEVRDLPELPITGSLGVTNLLVDFQAADSIQFRNEFFDAVEYEVVVSQDETEICQIPGQLELDEKTKQSIAEAGTSEMIEIKELQPLRDGLPDFLVPTAPVQQSDLGIRVGKNLELQTKHQRLLEHDFVFEALLTFERGDTIAVIGLGNCRASGISCGLKEAVYLRFHSPWLGDGLIDVRHSGGGVSHFDEKVNWEGTHLVRISKTGSAVRFYIDPDHDGPSSDDLEVYIPDIQKYAPFLRAGNCPIFLTGSGTIVAARLEMYPINSSNVVDSPMQYVDSSGSLDRFAVGNNTFQRIAHGGIRVMSGGPIRTRDRDYLDRDFILEVLMAFQPDDDFMGIGIGRDMESSHSSGSKESVYLRVNTLKLGGEGVVQGGTSGVSRMSGKIPANGTHRIRMIKKGATVTFQIDPEDDGPSDDDMEITIPNIREYAPFLHGKNSNLLIGGKADLLEVRLIEDEID
ncbi:MAG: trypsin-like peptidase domain-containing protein [Planctomycetaceae bacterium]|nr:trypsin-like peptidase domain-containing protein [Planctomycetaceae bacterium]